MLFDACDNSGEKFESLIYQVEVPFQPINRDLFESIASTGLPYLSLVSLGVALLAVSKTGCRNNNKRESINISSLYFKLTNSLIGENL